MDDESKEQPKVEAEPSELEKIGLAFQKIGKVLAQLPDNESRLRVIRAVAILNGIELGGGQ